MPPIDSMTVGEKSRQPAHHVEVGDFAVVEPPSDRVDLVAGELAFVRGRVRGDRDQVPESPEGGREGDRFDENRQSAWFERSKQRLERARIRVVERGVADEDVEGLQRQRRLEDIADDEPYTVPNAVELGSSFSTRDQVR